MRRQLADHGIFLLRISVSLLMLTHGIPKVLNYQTLVQTFPDPLNVGVEVSANLMIFAEVGCSVLLLIGLLGRFASVTLFIAMMVAAFVQRLTLTGPGSSSIDAWVSKKVLEKPEPALPKPLRGGPEARP